MELSQCEMKRSRNAGINLNFLLLLFLSEIFRLGLLQCRCCRMNEDIIAAKNRIINFEWGNGKVESCRFSDKTRAQVVLLIWTFNELKSVAH